MSNDPTYYLIAEFNLSAAAVFLLCFSFSPLLGQGIFYFLLYIMHSYSLRENSRA